MFYDQALAPFGLRTTQYSILNRLQRSGPWTVQALAATMVMDRTTLGRTIRPLERDGLVVTEVDAVDRRVRSLRITPEGQARLSAAIAGWELAQSRFEAAVGAEEAAQMRVRLGQVSRTRF